MINRIHEHSHSHNVITPNGKYLSEIIHSHIHLAEINEHHYADDEPLDDDPLIVKEKQEII